MNPNDADTCDPTGNDDTDDVNHTGYLIDNHAGNHDTSEIYDDPDVCRNPTEDAADPTDDTSYDATNDTSDTVIDNLTDVATGYATSSPIYDVVRSEIDTVFVSIHDTILEGVTVDACTGTVEFGVSSPKSDDAGVMGVEVVNAFAIGVIVIHVVVVGLLSDPILTSISVKFDAIFIVDETWMGVVTEDVEW